jgi:mannan endo-1,4-beta-mannosidase
VCQTLTNARLLISGPQRLFPPVADNDTAVTDFGTPVTMQPAANDIAYRTKVRPGSIDLDPAAAGQQRSLTVAGGQFVLVDGGSLAFTPAEGFSGKATASYTIRDEAGRTSNVADVVVTVKPDPGAAIRIASWETGTEGWAPGNWQTNAGTFSQTGDFNTDGSFGVTLPEPLDLSAKSTVKFDLRTRPDAGTSRSVVFEVGPQFTWCQSTFVWVPQNSNVTAEVDLLSEMSCDPATFNDVRGVFLWISPGQFDLDNLRAE